MMKRLALCALLCQLAFGGPASAQKRPVAKPLKQAKLHVPKKGSLSPRRAKPASVKRSVSFETTTQNVGYGIITAFGEIKTTGYLPGDTMHFEKQEVSGKVDTTSEGLGLRRAIAKALAFSPHEGFYVGTENKRLHGATYREGVYASSFRLPEFSDFGATQAFGLARTIPDFPPFRLHPEGPEQAKWGRRVLDTSYRIVMKRAGEVLGSHMGTFPAGGWMNLDNLFVSPIYETSEGGTEAVVLGLAAFPIGSEITITNMTHVRQGHAEPQYTFGQASYTAGSARITIPNATPGDEYKLSVGSAGGGGLSETITFRLPAHDHPLVVKNGMGYFDLKHFRVEQ